MSEKILTINYPIYTQEEIDRRLIEVIKFVLSIPEERLKEPEAQERERSKREQAHNGSKQPSG